MDVRVRTWLGHIITAIEEIDDFFAPGERMFEKFCFDTRTKRAVERNLEIIGEAVNRILARDPDFPIEDARKIVGLRNYVIHAYDGVSNEALWSVVINNLPTLKQEVEKLLKENETL